MSRKPKSARRKGRKSSPGWFASLDDDRRRTLIRRCCVGAAILVVLTAISFGLTRLDAWVHGRIARDGQAVLDLRDMPDGLAALAEDDVRSALEPLVAESWLDEDLCREVAARASAIGWIESVEHVRRTADRRIELRCTYRMPTAMVQKGDQFFLVDEDGVRLPGEYRYDSTWLLLQGVSAGAPAPGVQWAGDDLRAGLATIRALQGEPFMQQITGVLLANFGGRMDSRQPHLALATDRAGGRILWGSAPGDEIAENNFMHKIAVLRTYYERTGRVDANHAVVDVSTYRDGAAIQG